MNKSRKLWISFVVVALIAVPSASSAGWKIKLGNKTISGGGQQDQKTQAAPATPDGPSQVCDSSTALHLCYAFSGKDNSESNTSKGNQMACKFMKGRFLASSTCQSTGALGKCTVLKGQPKEYSLYYYPGGSMRFTASSAERDCKNPKSSIHIQGPGEWATF